MDRSSGLAISNPLRVPDWHTEACCPVGTGVGTGRTQPGALCTPRWLAQMHGIRHVVVLAFLALHRDSLWCDRHLTIVRSWGQHHAPPEWLKGWSGHRRPFFLPSYPEVLSGRPTHSHFCKELPAPRCWPDHNDVPVRCQIRRLEGLSHLEGETQVTPRLDNGAQLTLDLL